MHVALMCVRRQVHINIPVLMRTSTHHYTQGTHALNQTMYVESLLKAMMPWAGEHVHTWLAACVARKEEGQ
eukprot:scaffold314293_cov28-Tisochrysis_lutea.AAC.1